MSYDISGWVYNQFPEADERNGEVRVHCPFCYVTGSDHYLFINLGKLKAHCFHCHWGGSGFRLVMEVSGAGSYAEVWSMLKRPRVNLSNYQTIADRLAQNIPETPKLETAHMPDWFVPFDGARVDMLHANVLRYALSRFNERELRYYGIGYCTDFNSPYISRMIIPIERGYFQARAIGKNTVAKYLNPDFELGDRLFNGKALELHKRIYIAEGAISAKAIGLDAVATLKNAASRPQIERFKRSLVEHFVICYDAGFEHSGPVVKLADELSAVGKQVTIRIYAEGDPDSSNEFTETPYTSRYKISSLFHQKRTRPKNRRNHRSVLGNFAN